MSFGRDIAGGVANQIFIWLLIAMVIGGVITAAFLFGVPWVWNHVSIVVK